MDYSTLALKLHEVTSAPYVELKSFARNFCREVSPSEESLVLSMIDEMAEEISLQPMFTGGFAIDVGKLHINLLGLFAPLDGLTFGCSPFFNDIFKVVNIYLQEIEDLVNLKVKAEHRYNSLYYEKYIDENYDFFLNCSEERIVVYMALGNKYQYR